MYPRLSRCQATIYRHGAFVHARVWQHPLHNRMLPQPAPDTIIVPSGETLTDSTYASTHTPWALARSANSASVDPSAHRART
eukprot:7391605-Prymnesium_polylepis.3